MLLDLIEAAMRKEFTEEFIKSLKPKTKDGSTQSVERIYIEKMKEVLHSVGCTFVCASSQKSKDFQNVTDGMDSYNIEAKKTSSKIIKLNDTLPVADVHYFVIFTGDKTYPPQTFWCRGDEFTESSPWMKEYNNDLEALRDKWGRGPNKKTLPGIMQVFPRKNIDVNITSFLST